MSQGAKHAVKRIPPSKTSSVSSSGPTELSDRVYLLSPGVDSRVVRPLVPSPCPMVRSWCGPLTPLSVCWLTAFLFSQKDTSLWWPFFHSLRHSHILLHNHTIGIYVYQPLSLLIYLKHWFYLEYMFSIVMTHLGLSEVLIVFLGNRQT